MAATILVVDDEQDILELVSIRLDMAGYRTVLAASGEEALRSFFVERPDLAIVDIDLPAMDGIELCSRMREMSDIPVIFLSAMGSELDRVKGLQAGADDYIVKPFAKEELVARVEAVMRRATMPAVRGGEDSYIDAQLTIDHRAHIVAVRGREVALSPLEYRLLTSMVRHSGQVLSHNQLLDMAWGPNATETSPDSVRLYISYLRAKIEEHPKRPMLIETVREFGYRYVRPTYYEQSEARAA
ncbi:MAG: response regulator transcription factor [Chloroflexi bacterium]|nr:response regulator transcription factor [Chloroflexota bacterium]MDA1296607.1 response regulator transcription factor [Chloroflexota bacterium]